METSIFSSKPIPQFPNPFKQEPQFPHSPKPINPKLSFPKKPLLKYIQLKEAVTSLTHNHRVTSDTYISLLQSCIDLDAIDLGRKLHANISTLHDNINNIIFVETKLVSMYAKCGSLKDARQVFDLMRERNLFTWSAMIGGYAREQRWSEIIELFYCMMGEGVVPDEFLLPKVLQACGNVGDVRTGEMVHSFAIRYGLVKAIQVGNCLVSMYAKCGKLECARMYFEKMEEKVSVTWNAIISGYCLVGDNEEATRLFRRMLGEGVEPGLITWNIMIACYNQAGNCDLAMQLMKKMSMCGIAPDVFTWTSMISGCDQNKREREALELFRQMVLVGVEPNGVTIASAVSACSSLRALRQGKELHSVGVKLGDMGDLLLGNALIEMYSKCGEFEAAESIFDMMVEKDVFTWNSMISGYIQAGYFGKAYHLFKRMQGSPIKPNVVTWNVLISGYIHVRDEDQAMELFQRMEEDGIIKRNASSWNSLISGFLHNGETNKAFKIFRQMQFSTRPSSITMLTILPACANLLASKKVKEIHGYVFRRGFELEIPVANILIEAYARSGNIHYSRAIFEALPSTDVISWNTIIAGYVLHGCPSIALDLFKRMILGGSRPNKGTFASIIMAYGHAGMVEEGNMAFTTMINDYLLPPGSEHYSAMLDLLGRSDRLGEATNFIEDLGIEQESSVWYALLTASRVHGNIGLAVHAAECLFALEPKNAVVHRLLLQLYALSGDSKELLRLRTSKTRAMNDTIGCSLIEYRNEVHTIMTGDWYVGKKSDLIYAQLSRIAEEIKTTFLGSHETQLCIDEEEKEEISGVHSEKLAISFALISSPYSSQKVRIVKNFRMCRDCHETAKFISLRYGREIYLYDKKCFHHFKNGLCSCKDYW